MDLSYVAGVYFSSERSRERSQSLLFDLSPAAAGVEQINSGVIRNRTLAGYAQGTYDLSDATGIAGANAEGAQGQHERVRPRPDPDGVGRARVGGELGLEPSDPRAEDELTRAEGVQDGGLEPLLQRFRHAEVEKPNHEPRPPRRRAAATRVFCISIATVIGPTPPGTGVR